MDHALSTIRASPEPTAALFGVRRNQAGIHRKTFSPDQSGRNTGLNDTLEDLAEDVTVTKPFIAGTRERRVIRNLVLNAQAAEPAIRQIDLDGL